MRAGRVLIIDDLVQWREQLVETLMMGGLFAEAVATTTEALQKLEESYYHLLIVDISMNESDAGNTEGITFLSTLQAMGLTEVIHVVVLSAHGTPKLLRESFHYYHVLDFLSKDIFDSQEFLQIIRTLFADKMKINLNLEIHWESKQIQKQILANLAGNDPTLLLNRSQELDDLLCRLFYQASGILIKPLGIGYDGNLPVLKVQPSYMTGVGRTLILKLDATHMMREEQQKLLEFVRSYIGGARSTTILEVRRTLHLGGAIYTLLGTSEDKVEDFAHFYQRAEEEAIWHVFEDLLVTCNDWYRNIGSLQLYNLTDDYIKTLGLSLETLEELIEPYVSSPATIQLSASLKLPYNFLAENPLQVIKNHSFTLPTYACITHGMLNQHNLLVDEAQHVWMIHFQKTGRGHFLRDVAMLDSVIRFQLLETEHATLAERLLMEHHLCNGRHFEQWDHIPPPFHSDNQQLVKAYTTILHLRQLFYKYLALASSTTIAQEYAIALLYHALYHFSCVPLSSTQREHALLYASLLSQYLQ
ncbi:MAG TPA: response regulator [Ktedonobacteraceae bacterium]|jgi:CheY-like chemotaxis protein|nr:response regulator [Ktedonobacteraceae bacterium]